MRRSDRGLTLLELVVVTLLIGLIAAAVVVRMDFLIPKYRLRGAAREVGSVLKQAKSRAASTGRDVWIEFDVSQGEVWLMVAFPKPKDDGSLPTGDEPVTHEYQPSMKQTLPDGVHFEDVILGPQDKVGGGRVRVRVTPYGASEHVIVNLSMDERPMAVRLNGLTGVVTYHEERLEADDLMEDAGEP